MNSLRRISIHESGHIIANFLAGSRLCGCTVSEDEGETIVNHPLMKMLHEVNWPHPILKSFCDCMLAGVAAQSYDDCEIRSCKKPIYSDTDDIRVAMSMLEACGWIAPHSQFSEDSFYKIAGVGARLLVIGNWSKIIAIAEELEKHRKMSGQALAKILETLYQPLSEKAPKALRYWHHL